MVTRAQLVAAINTFRGRTPTNPIDDDELADFLRAWLDYYDQNGVWNPADVQTLMAQNVGLQNAFIARSLNLTATIYVDGVNGNDIRTGTTNDNNAVTGAVKTLNRVAQLHSGKTQSLEIVITGNLDVITLCIIEVPFVLIRIMPGVTLTFRKTLANKDLSNVIVGEGTAKLTIYGFDLNILNQGTITVESHAGSTGLGDQYYYRQQQGAICLSGYLLIDSNRLAIFNVTGGGTLNVGDNTIFACSGPSGVNGDSINKLARYRRSGVIGGTVVLGTNAIESYFFGDRTIIRRYTPTSSTDLKVEDSELVGDSSYLYSKRDGVIKKIAWTSF